jgi:predicted lipoprotein with Yx(FWY)xxD motif
MLMRVRYFSALAALAVIGAGCASSSSSSSQPSSRSAATAAASSSSAKPGAQPVTITTKQAKKLGTILAAGNKRLTVYLFAADTGASSTCSAACAGVWPPVTGKPQATGAAVAGSLGTITRSDGTTQVTYKGHPLYFYDKDKDSGDAYGQAIKSYGANWYVLTPTGTQVGASTSSASTAGKSSPSTTPASTHSAPASQSSNYQTGGY